MAEKTFYHWCSKYSGMEVAAVNPVNSKLKCHPLDQSSNVGLFEKVSALVHSPPVEGWQAKPDGVVVVVLH